MKYEILLEDLMGQLRCSELKAELKGIFPGINWDVKPKLVGGGYSFDAISGTPSHITVSIVDIKPASDGISSNLSMEIDGRQLALPTGSERRSYLRERCQRLVHLAHHC